MSRLAGVFRNVEAGDYMNWPENWVRRALLARYSFMRKGWHRRSRRLARLRALYWVLVRGHDSEICARCGGPVRVVFHVPDAIWEAASGFLNAARSPGGESGAGVLCIPCVDDLAHEAGLMVLIWTCSFDDSVMVG